MDILETDFGRAFLIIIETTRHTLPFGTAIRIGDAKLLKKLAYNTFFSVIFV